MIELKNYIVTEILHEGATAVVCRAVRRRDGSAVIVKTFRSESPPPRDVERLRHEYATGQLLDSPYAFTPSELDTQESLPILVYADLDCEPLSRLMATPIEAGRFLDLAIRLAVAVVDIHRQGFIHKDIKPANILIPPDLEDGVKLTGFGLASPLPRFPGSAPLSSMIEGSLPYMSPEQSGRMNRTVDHRSDLYSLGITFYEMLTGILPFQAADPLEWVHCHIARQPRPPAEILPSIPEPISAIVMKLLAKPAEERYQSARGLQTDLQRCRVQWISGGRIAGFPLAEQDVTDQFLTPWKLYGRDREMALLLKAFDRVMASGKPEFMLVSGNPGIGKSTLVQSLAQPIVHERGFFIAGKVEQQGQDIPYAAINRAVDELIQQVMSESDERIRHHQEELQQALGKNGRIITDNFPRAGLLLENQPPVPELPQIEAERRFRLMFQKFIGVFTKKEHPLALFLDDLQWLDQASLGLIAYLITHSDTQYLFLIGAYRDTEVGPSHPLMIALNGIRSHGDLVHEVILEPLAVNHLTRLVADTVHRSLESVVPLARLVHAKTGGNPFFTLQFLMTLYQEELLAYAAQDGKWHWDLEEIHRQNFTDNVAELMIGKLKQLPAAALEPLKLAACVGNAIEGRILKLICDDAGAGLHAALEEAVNAGLFVHYDNSYRFLHDRVREAAYRLVPEEQRAGLHLTIGRRMLSRLSPEQLEPEIFGLASQFNLGARLITERGEQLRVAALDLRAAKKAKASTAYREAVGYLETAVALLGGNPWEQQHELAFAVYLELAECHLLSGNFDQAESGFPLLLNQALTPLEKAGVYLVKIDTHNIKGEGGDAIDCALECLRMFDIGMSAHPTADEVHQAYEAIRFQLGDRSIEELIDLPLMTDPGMQTVMEILSRLYIPAYYSDNNLFYLHICQGVNLSLRHGNSPASTYAYGWFGVLMATTFHRPREGYRFAGLAYELMERHRFLSYKPKVCMHLKFVAYWSQSLDKAIEYARAMFEAGQATGDVAAACFSFSETLFCMISRGDYLAEVQREAERGLDFTRRAGFRDVNDLILSLSRFVQTMRGRTRHLSTYDDEHFNEAEFEAGLDRERMPTLVFYHDAVKLMARYLAGDFKAALAFGEKSKSLLWAGLFSPASHYFFFYYGLTLTAVFDDLSPERRKEALVILDAHLAQLREWAQNCPRTFHHAYTLLRAEIARITGREQEAERLYEEATISAHQSGLVHNEAVAHELAARFHGARGMFRISDLYLREARVCYQRWGADGKVRQFDRAYPHLVESRPLSSGMTITTATEHFDLLSVLKASQSISREILLPDLQGTLMRLVLEQAGAQRALLLMGEGENLQIQAQAETSGEETGIDLMPVLPVSSATLPMSIIGYVRRTGESVILADAAASGYAADDYIVRRQPRSVLCLPIVRQAGVVGLLYLENNLTAGAFTAHTLMTLELLAAQAAISLESASLYADLRKENADRRRAEAELRQHREHLEELVARRTEELTAAKARAEEADRLKSFFLATMSHELRTPLNSIIGFTGIMLQGMVGPLSDEQQLQLGMVKGSARHLLDLINDILDLSKIEAGQVEIRPELFDLRALIDKTIRLLKPLAGKKALQLTAEVPSEAGLLVSDPRRVEQILLNLVNNAIKFTEQGHVRITCRLSDGSLMTSVTDTGIGIKPENMDKLFVTFRQLDDTSERKHEGTGLGLSICRKLANLLGGEILVESIWGRGSSFTLVLPLKREGGKDDQPHPDHRG